MNALLKLLPSLREVRAPLAAGYLWLLFIWLAWGAHLPGPETNATFGRLWDIFDAIRPIGVAIVVSILAYLVGSLSQLAFEHLRVLLLRFGTDWSLVRFFVPVSMLSEGRQIYPPEDRKPASIPISEVPTKVRAEIQAGSWSGDRLLEESYRDLIDQELLDAQRELSDAVHYVRQTKGNDVALKRTEIDGIAFLEVPVATGIERCEIPKISLIDTFWLIASRLFEVSERSALKIEELFSEAAFREGIAPPLAVLAGTLCLQVSVFWLLGLIVPLALLWQARLMRLSALRQLLDALRARAGTEEMEQITPIFARSRRLISQLATAIRDGSWDQASEPAPTS